MRLPDCADFDVGASLVVGVRFRRDSDWRELGWMVGVVETDSRAWAWALNMEGERVWEDWPPPKRQALVTSILESLDVVEPAPGGSER